MTLTQAYRDHVKGMIASDRRDATRDFVFMQIDTLARRGLSRTLPANVRPVAYRHAFMDQFSDDEIIQFKPTITAARTP